MCVNVTVVLSRDVNSKKSACGILLWCGHSGENHDDVVM